MTCTSAAQTHSLQSPCGNNAVCRDTVVGYYCSCKTGFYGNPNSKCISGHNNLEIIVMDLVVKISGKFSSFLKDQQDPRFWKNKLASEEIFEYGFRKQLNYIQNSVQILSFEYQITAF